MISSFPSWTSDKGDGTFSNPPLYADYPDPDIIRVGKDFYFVTTTFANVPGLLILHSKDLVNWELKTRVVARLEGREQYDLHNGNSYRAGLFAPSLRHYNGFFYVVVTPVGQNTRIYRTRDLTGAWEESILDREAFDPGLFIEADGTGYIATSGGWDGTICLLTLNRDYTRVVGGQNVHYVEGAEGCKLIKRGDWYYLFNAIPRRLALTVSRAKSLLGPWETVEQLNDTTGGHQGALVDIADDTWYGFVMVDAGGIGRMTNISPVFWENDWPVWGTPDAPGRVPATARKPIQNQPLLQPATSDDFDTPQLGLQWQWNHNPDDSRWSLTDRPGFLRLRPTRADNFWTARNTLTQKSQGLASRGEVKLDLRQLQPGDICGFGTLGKFNGHIAINCDEVGRLFLTMSVTEDTREGLVARVHVPRLDVEAPEIFLAVEMDFEDKTTRCFYSLDANAWTPLGSEFEPAYDWQTGTFQGPQYAIFCYNPNHSNGYVDVDWFHFSGKK